MQKKDIETIDELRSRIALGDYHVAAEILKGKYKYRTIRDQVMNYRTLKPIVFETMVKVVSNREKLIQAETLQD